MREVIVKDLLLNRTTLMVNLAVFIATFGLLTSMGVDSPRVVAVFAGLMVAFIPVTLVTREDKARTMALSCSLPVSRRTIVRARYVLGLAMATTMALALLTAAGLVPTSGLVLLEVLRPSTLLLCLSIVVILVSLLLPLTFRFGAMGVFALLAAFQVLGVVLLTIAQVTHSNADLRIASTLVQGVRSVAAALGMPLFYLVLGVTLAALVAASYRASVFVFERKDI